MTGTAPTDTIICGDCLEEMKKLPARLDRWAEAEG